MLTVAAFCLALGLVLVGYRMATSGFVMEHQSLQPPPRRVLLTGATGMVGSRILRDLLDLDPSIEIGCIVRGVNDKESAAARLRQAMSKFGYHRYDSSRIEAIVGDITTDRLGMDDDSYRRWKNVDSVVHCAADISSLARTATTTNVVGVKNVLDFCSSGDRLSTLHFMSSMASCMIDIGRGSVPEKLGLSPQRTLPGGYGENKYDAEVCIQAETHRLGLKSFVYRAPFILSRSGFQPKSFPALLVKLILLTKAIPHSSSYLPLFPLDGVARALTCCILYGDTCHAGPGFVKTLHLAETNQSMWPEQVDLIRKAFLEGIEEVDMEQFCQRAHLMASLYPKAKYLGTRNVLGLIQATFESRYALPETKETQEFLENINCCDLSAYKVQAEDFVHFVSMIRDSFQEELINTTGDDHTCTVPWEQSEDIHNDKARDDAVYA